MVNLEVLNPVAEKPKKFDVAPRLKQLLVMSKLKDLSCGMLRQDRKAP